MENSPVRFLYTRLQTQTDYDLFLSLNSFKENNFGDLKHFKIEIETLFSYIFQDFYADGGYLNNVCVGTWA